MTCQLYYYPPNPLILKNNGKGGRGWGIPLCPDSTFGSEKCKLTIAIIGLPGKLLGLKKMPVNSGTGMGINPLPEFRHCPKTEYLGTLPEGFKERLIEAVNRSRVLEPNKKKRLLSQLA